jgi:hypothetical protein
MASAYFSSNVTKFNAGGSGDNVIADGYIKTVEKVWLDSYTIAFTSTKTTLDIAVLPDNKKVTSIDIMIATTAAQTNGTLSIGWSEDAAYGTVMSPVTITHNGTLSTISLPAAGILGAVVALTQGNDFKIGAFQEVTSGTKTTLALQFNNWTMTSGTVKTVVRYT